MRQDGDLTVSAAALGREGERVTPVCRGGNPSCELQTGGSSTLSSDDRFSRLSPPLMAGLSELEQQDRLV